MSPTAAKILEASAARIELEVPIEASIDEVWRAVVERPDAWWVSELRCVPGASKVTLDARAGGNLVEHNDRGGSLLWFTVIAVDPPRSINFAGAIAPPFGGPCTAFLLLELADRDGVTLVKMTNSLHGHVDESSLPDIESGWRLLLENGLKRFVETGQRA
jgi:uncharacterized protein YndB with AHSA1/START domain